MKTHSLSWSERHNISKMSALYKLYIYSTQSQPKPTHLFVEVDNLYYNLYGNAKKPFFFFKGGTHRLIFFKFQNILQSYSNQDGVVLARAWIYTLLGQYRESRYKTMCTWSTDFLPIYQGNSMGEENLLTKVLYELDWISM